MKRLIAGVAVLLLAGCGQSGPRALHASFDTNLAAGTTTLACKSSSSGTCHAVFVTSAGSSTLSAAAGASATAKNLAPGTAFCVDVEAPDAAKCGPQPLSNGQQIFSSQSVEKH